MSPRLLTVLILAADRPRAIDRYIDYFGEHRPEVLRRRRPARSR
jgi:hypothetical protein